MNTLVTDPEILKHFNQPVTDPEILKHFEQPQEGQDPGTVEFAQNLKEISGQIAGYLLWIAIALIFIVVIVSISDLAYRVFRYLRLFLIIKTEALELERKKTSADVRN